MTMIQTLLADPESHSLQTLASHLAGHCPQVTVSGMADSGEEAFRLLRELNPDLVFIDAGLACNSPDLLSHSPPAEFEAILLHDEQLAGRSLPFPAGAWLHKPVNILELITVVRQAEHWLHWKRKFQENRLLLQQLADRCPSKAPIAIPTLDGLEFLLAAEIIRCEGLQRLTKVYTERGVLISSYNIGEFCRMLCPYGFFAPHKSHLINLQYLLRYHVEGNITLRDGTRVPLARRRKVMFLEQLQCL
jgi:two-component system LytT family response regulator